MGLGGMTLAPPSAGITEQRRSYGLVVASIAALRAIGPTDRPANQWRTVDAVDAWYEYEEASVAADDGNLVLRPDDLGGGDPGRWEKRTGAGAAPPAAHGSTHTDGTDDVPDLVGDTGAGGTHGLVPAPVTGEGAQERILRAAGVWDIPSHIGFLVRKGSAGTIAKGRPVCIVGYNIGQDVPEVEESQADAAATMPAIGLTNEAITNSTNGLVRVWGQVAGSVAANLDTSSFAAGDEVFVSAAVAGDLQNTRPTGGTSLIQKVGEVLRSHATLGVIEVYGAGRVNAAPNIAEDNVFVGDANGIPQAVSFDTKLSVDGSIPLTAPWDTGAFNILTRGIQARAGVGVALRDSADVNRIAVDSDGDVTINPPNDWDLKIGSTSLLRGSGTTVELTGSLFSKFDIEANTAVAAAPNVILAAESRRVYTNEGVAAENVHELPPAAAGLEYSWIVEDANGIRVDAVGDDTIRVGATVSAAAGRIQSATVGNAIRLVAVNATQWMAKPVVGGGWTVDGAAADLGVGADVGQTLIKTTDNIATILNAASSGDSFLLAEGTHTADAQIDFTGKTDISITGVSWNSVLVLFNGSPGLVLGSAPRIQIRKLYLRSAGGTWITHTGIVDFLLQGCRIDAGVASTVFFSNVTDNQDITRCRIEGNYVTGTNLTTFFQSTGAGSNTVSLIFRKNIFLDMQGVTINLVGTGDTDFALIEGNHLQTSTANFLTHTGGDFDDSKVQGNFLTALAGSGISVTDATRSQFNGNWITNSAEHTIALLGNCQNVTIGGNRLWTTSTGDKACLFLTNPVQVFVGCNHLRNDAAGGDGVKASGGSHLHIVSNTISGNRAVTDQNGIVVTGTMSGLSIHSNYIVDQGEDTPSTVSDGNGILIASSLSGHSLEANHIEDCENYGILITSADWKGTINGGRIVDCRSGIHVADCAQASIRNVDIINPAGRGVGIIVNTNDGPTISNVTVTSSGDHAFNLIGTTAGVDLRLRDCNAFNVTGIGFRIVGFTGGVVKGCYAKTCSTNGIELDAATEITVRGNKLVGISGTEIIESNAADDNDIQDNTLLSGTITTVGASTHVWNNWDGAAEFEGHIHLGAGTAVTGSTAPSWSDPTGNSIGGWLMDNANETLLWDVDVHKNWDAVSDMTLEVFFELGVAGAAAPDTVDLSVTFNYKGVGDTVPKTQTVEVATTVGAAAQYTMFKASFVLDHDLGGNVLDKGDILSMVINIETDTSEVDAAIITHANLLFQKLTPACQL